MGGRGYYSPPPSLPHPSRKEEHRGILEVMLAEDTSAGLSVILAGGKAAAQQQLPVPLGAQHTPPLAVGKLVFIASMSINRALLPSVRAVDSASASIAGVRSILVTRCPAAESKIAKYPVPVPTSSISSRFPPGRYLPVCNHRRTAPDAECCRLIQDYAITFRAALI